MKGKTGKSSKRQVHLSACLELYLKGENQSPIQREGRKKCFGAILLLGAGRHLLRRVTGRIKSCFSAKKKYNRKTLWASRKKVRTGARRVLSSLKGKNRIWATDLDAELAAPRGGQ